MTDYQIVIINGILDGPGVDKLDLYKSEDTSSSTENVIWRDLRGRPQFPERIDFSRQNKNVSVLDQSAFHTNLSVLIVGFFFITTRAVQVTQHTLLSSGPCGLGKNL